MIIMFITFMILAAFAFKLGAYSVLFGILKVGFAALFFLSGGFILYWLWKRSPRQKPIVSTNK